MDDKEIKEKLKIAIKRFVERDWKELYKNDIHENTFSHRIAVYLEKYFKKYNVDCEYNKILGDKKVNERGEKIRPDIIIHKRDNMNCNILIIEIKKAGNKSIKFENDINKLKKSQNLNYNLGAVIGILKNTINLIFIKFGNETDHFRFNDSGEEKISL